jgi:hypothetical protein
MYDVIGDIHGCADELVQLLELLGYREQHGVYRHPARRVLFCGDFIDRGPRIRDVLRICQGMCENDSALAVLGNHELNALAFHTPHPEPGGGWLRARSEQNVRQHRATLDQLDERDFAVALDWFRRLPASLDLGALRAVHACWDPVDLRVMSDLAELEGWLSAAWLRRAFDANDRLFAAVERVLKGPEVQLPGGLRLLDREGHARGRARIRWYEEPGERSCGEYLFPAVAHAELVGVGVPATVRPCPYPADAPPLFFGHYWLADATPAPLAANLACLDYSVARGGQLAAYRFTGERVLRAGAFVTVRRREDREWSSAAGAGALRGH